MTVMAMTRVRQKKKTSSPLKQEIHMTDVQVTCINKQPRNDPHHGITHLGGSNWKWTRDEVIVSIENKTNTFYTMANGVRANVGVVNGEHGKYVRTYSNGKWDDNLLSLPECR